MKTFLLISCQVNTQGQVRNRQRIGDKMPSKKVIAEEHYHLPWFQYLLLNQQLDVDIRPADLQVEM